MLFRKLALFGGFFNLRSSPLRFMYIHKDLHTPNVILLNSFPEKQFEAEEFFPWSVHNT